MPNLPAPPTRTRARSRAFGGALGAAARGAVRARRERGLPRADRTKPAGVRIPDPAPAEPEYALLVDDDESAELERAPEHERAAEPEYALIVDDDEDEPETERETNDDSTHAGAPRSRPAVARDAHGRPTRHAARRPRPAPRPVREPETTAYAPRDYPPAPRTRPRPVPARPAPSFAPVEPLAVPDHADAPGGLSGDPASTPDGAISVDPRIHARRVAVAREEVRRRRRIVGVLVGLLTALTALVVAVYSPMLDVERVDVAGAAPDQVAAIRTAAGVSRGDALLRVSPGRVEARLEALPWIAHASVSRDLPDTVHITVSIRQAIAWVAVPAPKGTGGTATAALVDGSGHVMSGVLVAPAGLPQLVGLTTRGRPGTQVAHAAAAHVAAILPPGLRNLASTLSVRHGLVTMGVGGGPEIRFGTADHLAAKGRTALAILGSLSHPVHYIDVRVPTAPVTG